MENVNTNSMIDAIKNRMGILKDNKIKTIGIIAVVAVIAYML